MRTPDEKLAQRRRDQILKAAIACFVKNGFHSTGMKAICQAADMSPGAVYRYFPGKAEIIRAIVTAEKSHAGAAIDALQNSKDFRTALLKLVGRLVADACKEPDNVLATEILAEACRDVEVAAILRDSECALVSQLKSVLEEAQRSGRITLGVTPRELAELIMALSYGTSGYRLIDPSFTKRRAVLLAKSAIEAHIQKGGGSA